MIINPAHCGSTGGFDRAYHSILSVAWCSLLADFGTSCFDQLWLACHFRWHKCKVSMHSSILWCFIMSSLGISMRSFLTSFGSRLLSTCLSDLIRLVQISSQRYWRLLLLQDSSWWYLSKATTWNCLLLLSPGCNRSFLLLLHAKIGVWHVLFCSRSQY